VVIASALVTTAAAQESVTFVDHVKVAEALAKGEALAVVQQQAMIVLGSHGAGPQQPEFHDKETEIFYITEGDATFVSGGTIVTTISSRLRFTGIINGESRNLTEGDVIVIPAGTPHWFKEVPKSISYFVVKIKK
jgi:quercetin dioxygenase-like cupin family protein